LEGQRDPPLLRHPGQRQRIKSPLLYQNDSLDMGDAKSLREFVDWGVQNFPADRYALVLWNHGSGGAREPRARSGSRAASATTT
jgi:hypothetical protein